MKANEPVFPVDELRQCADTPVGAQHFGLDLRTHIAIEAMKGLLSHPQADYALMSPDRRAYIVQEAVTLADDLIEALNK